MCGPARCLTPVGKYHSPQGQQLRNPSPPGSARARVVGGLTGSRRVLVTHLPLECRKCFPDPRRPPPQTGTQSPRAPFSAPRVLEVTVSLGLCSRPSRHGPNLHPTEREREQGPQPLPQYLRKSWVSFPLSSRSTSLRRNTPLGQSWVPQLWPLRIPLSHCTEAALGDWISLRTRSGPGRNLSSSLTSAWNRKPRTLGISSKCYGFLLGNQPRHAQPHTKGHQAVEVPGSSSPSRLTRKTKIPELHLSFLCQIYEERGAPPLTLAAGSFQVTRPTGFTAQL